MSEPSPPSTLLCLHASELRPLAGIRLYSGVESIAGPSAADGILQEVDVEGRRIAIDALPGLLERD